MKRLALIAVSVLGVFGGILWVAAPGSTAAAPALTGQDYGEIMRLYGLYNQGSDFRDAEMFVSAFSSPPAPSVPTVAPSPPVAKPSLDGPVPRPSAPTISCYPAGARSDYPAGRVRDDHTVRGGCMGLHE